MAYALLPGEQTGVGGVVDTSLPWGLVERYTNGQEFHDAATITGTTNGTTTVSGVSADDIAKIVLLSAGAAADMQIVDVTSSSTNFIPDAATITAKGVSSFTLSAAATGSGTRTFRIGTNWEAVSAFQTAIEVNSLHPKIKIQWGDGETFGGWNLSHEYTGTKNNPCRMDFGRTKFGGVLHWIGGISYGQFEGEPFSYDRIGIASATITSVAHAVGSAVLGTAGVGTPFVDVPLGCMIMSSNLRTGRGEVIAKAVDNSTITVDQKAVANGSFTIQVCSNHLDFTSNPTGGHDNTKNTSCPGRGYRGTHIVTPFNLTIRGRLVANGCDQTIVDYTTRPGVSAPGATPVSAINLEISGGAGLKILGGIEVHNSATHGVTLIGALDCDVGPIYIHGYVSGGIDFPVSLVVPECTEAKSERGCGLLVKRCSGVIGPYFVKNKNEAPSASLQADVLIDEIGRADPDNEDHKPLVVRDGSYVEVGSPTASSGVGVQFGDPNADTAQMNLQHGRLTIMLREGYTLKNGPDATPYPMLGINVTSGTRSRIEVDVTIINPQGFEAVRGLWASGEKKVVIIKGSIQDIDTAGGLVNFTGHASAESYLDFSMTARPSTGSHATPLFKFSLLDGLNLHDALLLNQAANGCQALRIETCNRVRVTHSEFTNFRGSSVGNGGAISLGGAITDLILDGVNVRGDAAAAGRYGILLDSSLTLSHTELRGVNVSAYEYGFKKHASATISDPILLERCNAISCTTPSDIPAASRVRAA